MSLFSSLNNWLNNYFRVNPTGRSSNGNQQSTNFDPVQQAINSNPPIYPDADTEMFIRDGYSGNDSVYTIVNKASKKFGHITRGVYQIKDTKSFKSYKRLAKYGLGNLVTKLKAFNYQKKSYGGDGEEVDNDLSVLLARPNPYSGQDTFFRLIYIFYLLAGESFIWLNRGDTKGLTDDEAKVLPVLEMYVLPSQNVEIIPDMNDVWNVIGYKLVLYGQNGSTFIIRACDIIHWKNPNPNFDGGPLRTHLRGLSPLKAGHKVLQQADDSTDAAVAMYQNGGAKGVLFNKMLGTMTPTQKSELDALINKKINTSALKASVAVLNGEWSYENIGLDSVDMQLLEGADKAFERLCRVMDVPAGLWVLNQTYENKAATMKDWLTNCIIPDACVLVDEMNRVLLPAFNITGIAIDNDISDIPELQEDMGKLVAWLALFPWLTPNEKRVYIGEEPDNTTDGMDSYWIPSTVVKMEDAGMDGITEDLNNVDMNDYNPAPAKKPVVK